MNREIKFRGKRLYDNDCNKTKNGEWAFGYLTECFDGKKAIFKPYKSHLSPADKHRVDESTIGQFTGLRDMKGNDIYEGDILDTKSDKYCPNGYQFICKWIDSGFALVYQGMTYSEKRSNPWMNRYPLCKENVSDLVVIGNIFDNPELLKGGNV